MYIKTCLHCTKKFITEQSYSQSCLPCWKRERYYDLSKADFALEMCQDKLTELLEAMEPSDGSENDLIHKQNHKINELKAELKAEQAINRNLRNKLANALRAKGSNAVGLTKSFVMKLIGLCHPDKHGGNCEDADEATKELLRIRKSL